MGFWEKIFKKNNKKKEKKTIVLKLEELKVLLEKKSENLKKEFNEEAFAKFENIEIILNEAFERINEIKQKDFEAEGENTYLRKIVQSSKQGFTARMLALLEKTIPPKEKNFEKYFAFCNNASTEFEKEILSFRKNIAYTGILAKKEMIEIGKNIEELQKKLLELQELAKQQKVLMAEKLVLELNEAYELVFEKAKKQQEAKVLQETIESLKKEKTSLLEKTNALKQGKAFKEFNEKIIEKEKLLEEKKTLKEKAANMLAPLEKQLRKLQNLSESKIWVLEKEHERILNAYLNDAFNALKQDTKGETLKELFKELEKAIASGKISFKDNKEKSKKLQEIERIKDFDFFNEFFWKVNEIDKKLKALEEEIEKNNLFKELNFLQEKIESIERELTQKIKESEIEEINKARIEEKILKTVKKIEENSSEILNEKITIEKI